MENIIMARLANLNTYKAVFPDSQERSIAAENMADAIQTLADLHNGEPSLLQKTFTGMVISVPDPTISVKTEVTGAGAAENGCKATPYTIAEVKKGDKVWFTAIPAEGFVFGGWYLDDKLLSNDESYEATIEYNGTSPVTLNYEARFTVA